VGLSGGIETLCQRLQRAQQLLGGSPAVDEAHESLSKSDGKVQVTLAHGVTQLLLVAQCLGKILDSVATVAHFQHDVALLAQGVHQLRHGSPCGVGVTTGQLTLIKFAGSLIMGQHVHLLGLGLDDIGRCFHRHEQQGAEACLVALGEAFQHLLRLGEFLGGTTAVPHGMVCHGEIIEQ